MRLRAALAICALPFLSAASSASAACTLPNILTNGQIADATQVMDNFNAVASCTEPAVTTTGAPQSGAIATFSGAKTIASSNLSGDVTTSGGTTTTLANSGVVAGIYTNPTIIVDAKGRLTSASSGSGGGGSSWGFSPPFSTQFTLGSGNASFLTLQNDTDVGLLVDGGLPQGGDVNRIAYQVITNKNADWVLKVKIQTVIPGNNYSGAGIMIRDSISGRIISNSIRSDGTIAVAYWNGYAGWNSTQAAYTIRNPINWFSIRHQGTNYVFSISAEGKIWVDIATFVDTAWLTNKADQVGLTIDYNRNTGIKNVMSVPYYSLQQ